jgi:RNA polymerase sigma-70 factor, ECF subfamily
VSRNPDFEAFVAHHHDPVVRALTLALADRPRAEDAAQEAFAKAYRHWRRVAAMDRPVAWVYVVALNGARRELRRELAAPAPDLLGPAPDLAGPVSNRVSVQEALAVLAPRQRVAVVLRYLADLQVADVAAAMGVSVGTAKATLHTALARMRIELAPEESLEATVVHPGVPIATPTPRSVGPANTKVAMP